MHMPAPFIWVDPYLIRLYRLTGDAYVDFFLGTLALAGLALLLGELSAALVYRAIRRHVEEVAAEAVKYQNLSLEAARAGDHPAYQAANRLANEAFGKSFFLSAAMSAAFLWPAGFALGWMQGRFGEVEFHLPGMPFALGFAGVFIPLYLLAYLALKPLKRRLPWRRRLREMRQSAARVRSEPSGLAGTLPEPGFSPRGKEEI